MVKIFAVVAVVCLSACFLGANSDEVAKAEKSVRFGDWDDFLENICRSGAYTSEFSHLCERYTTTTTRGPRPPSGDSDEDDHFTPTTSTVSTDLPSTTTTSNTPLEQAHWCSFNNGSYLSLNQKFLYKDCAICQCTESHFIKCTNLSCMASYCIDGQPPVKREGQCCKQCAYEQTSNSCMVNGYTFPHGTLIGQTTDNIQCWCQLGTVECRKSAASLLSGLDYWGDGTAVYVIVIILLAVLLGGTFICCGGGLFFYHYYAKNQQSVQEAYAQYYGSAGWQPMGENGQVIVDGVGAEKQAEAEQQQYEYEYPTGESQEYIPPPYALYNGSYADPLKEKEQNVA